MSRLAVLCPGSRDDRAGRLGCRERRRVGEPRARARAGSSASAADPVRPDGWPSHRLVRPPDRAPHRRVRREGEVPSRDDRRSGRRPRASRCGRRRSGRTSCAGFKLGVSRLTYVGSDASDVRPPRGVSPGSTPTPPAASGPRSPTWRRTSSAGRRLRRGLVGNAPTRTRLWAPRSSDISDRCGRVTEDSRADLRRRGRCRWSGGSRRPRRCGRSCRPRRPCPRRGGRRPSCCRPRRRP